MVLSSGNSTLLTDLKERLVSAIRDLGKRNLHKNFSGSLPYSNISYHVNDDFVQN